MSEKSIPKSRSRTAYLCTDGWAGIGAQEVVVIGETPKKYRIQAVKRTKIAGYNRWLEIGQTSLVPKYAVRFTP
jgi:hypothetical protein